jgi:diguanylate cyclase (GGDEF)-like protein
MGKTLRGCFRAFDACGRVGGDEFMVFLRDIEPEAVLRSAQRVLEQAKRRFDKSELAGQVSISIGIALCPDHGADFETLYHAADRALYHVKNHGKGDLHVYSPEDEA